MKRLTITLLAVFAAAFSIQAQTDWRAVDRLIEEGSYKTAYSRAEALYRKKTAPSRERLAAAYYMAQAAAYYQEDARDSAEQRYRALMPGLDSLERALCHAFLGEYDSALMYSAVLQRTRAEEIKMYCWSDKGVNMTPTAYDIVMYMAIGSGEHQQRQRIEWQRRVCAFHAGDGDDLRLWNDLRLLRLLDGVPNRPLTMDTLLAYAEKWRGSRSQQLASLYVLIANHYDGKDYVKAVAWCDSALALRGESEGKSEARNMKQRILEKKVLVGTGGLNVMPGRASLQRVTYRNVDHLWLRVVPYRDDYRYSDKARAALVATPAVVEWDVALPTNKEYREEQALIEMPAIESGHWLLLASPTADFKRDGYMAYEVVCTDVEVIQMNGHEGMVVDRRTGAPVVGQEVRVERRQYRDGKSVVKVMASAVTDERGRYNLELKETTWGNQLVVERGGVKITTGYYSYQAEEPRREMRAQLCTDRPIYRQGDTLHVGVVAYYADGLEGEVAAGQPMKVTLYDPNHRVVTVESLETDAFGVAAVRFTIPADRLPGGYRVQAESGGKGVGNAYVRVEEYKQPKFMVTLGTEVGGRSAKFGRPYTVHGLAASYTEVPVSGARVQYSVTRTYVSYRYWQVQDASTEVVSGETVTAADGSFDITFIPEPDSSVELSRKPCFQYVATVTVTDLNGESHEATYRMRIGYKNAVVNIGNDGRVSYTDLDGNALGGDVEVCVERLQPPAKALLSHWLWDACSKEAHLLVGEEQWRKDFPIYARERGHNDPATWPMATRVSAVSLHNGDKMQGIGPASGTYRITVVAADADTLVVHRTITAPDERRVQERKLLWADVDKQSAEVGQRVTLRLGSMLSGTQIYYLLRVNEKERNYRHIVTRGDEIRRIVIDVDSAMLGGFDVDLVAVREGVVETWREHVEVPFSHKKLKVEIASFRDKLLPGENEEWTLSVKSYESGVRSSVVMTMYDEALDSYGGIHNWSLNPWRSNYAAGIVTVKNSLGFISLMKGAEYKYYAGNPVAVWTLKAALPYSFAKIGGIRMYKSAAVSNVAVADQMATARGESADLAVAAVEEEDVEEAALFCVAEKEERSDVQMRTNLSTLAFFAADVRTDSTGTATYRFTVPELLTRWHVKGLAVTRDLKSGTLDRMLITAKPLMVQPNMPRFLRNGDSLSLMAKVVVNEPKDTMEVSVSFLLTDAATGEVICRQYQHIAVKDAAQVMFDVEVPTSVHVATYEIRVEAEGMSDGERGQIPVVSNRQAVTVSQALYINGVGEKRFNFPMPEPSDTRSPNLLAAEVVSNPVWLAIKVMPYMKSLENPSTLYLAEQLYVNSMGRNILENLDYFEKIDTLAKKESPLVLNADVKQTLLQATPWVQAAESEEEQMRAVANYFDNNRMQQELANLSAQLATRQNADGGWSWMPEGESRLWVTQQVLKKLVVSSDESGVKRALAYVDKEQQRHYERYVKPYIKKYKWQPTDIDYLYTRSFYGKATSEAYRFYYNNALKHYKDYNGLYTQAQLALIFHRHGDHREAMDLLRRIKEKSLQSDEMGLYWRDNRAGWCWYERPIETQALLIRAFSEINPKDTLAIGLMKQWLLKQKQSTHWGNSRATAEAISALIPNEKVNVETGAVEMTVFGQQVNPHVPDNPEGYQTQRWTGSSLDSILAGGDNTITLRKTTPGIAWGAVYYQYTDEIDRIPAAESGISVKCSYSKSALKVGDRVTVRIEIYVDRAMDYLELVDGRPSCLEPTSTRAGWQWCDGMGCYKTVNQTDTRFYIEHLERGHYTLSYDLYVTNPGSFLSGTTTLQCMYAPEFRAIAPALKLTVAE